MPFNGAGMFVRLRNWVADAAAGVKIRADYHDIEDDGFADGLSQCIVKDGQTAITQNIPMNSKRIVALQDPVDPQDAATKAYADLKLPLTGGTITGSLDVAGSVGALGYRTRAGASGAYGGSTFNFYWTGNLQVWVDVTYIGDLATTAYANSVAATQAANYAAPKVNRAGDTITGNLQVNGELIAAATYLRFQYSGSPGYIIWSGGGSYSLGGGGVIWHTGNLNPIQDGRLVHIATVGISPDTGLHEPYAGSVITGLATTGAAAGVQSARWRQLQLLTPGGWYAVAYA